MRGKELRVAGPLYFIPPIFYVAAIEHVWGLNPTSALLIQEHRFVPVTHKQSQTVHTDIWVCVVILQQTLILICSPVGRATQITIYQNQKILKMR